MMTGELVKQLVRHEALRLKPYQDSVGKWTIGIGRNLDDKGISTEEAYLMLKNDIIEVEFEANRFAWFKKLNDARQMVVLNMLFNIGTTRFVGFVKMIAAIERDDFEDAAREMMDSKWAAQVGSRANELADMMKSGTYDT